MYYCKTIIIQNLHILLLLLRKHIRDQIGTLVEPLRADESVVLFHRQETKPKVIFVYKLLILLDDKLNIQLKIILFIYMVSKSIAIYQTHLGILFYLKFNLNSLFLYQLNQWSLQFTTIKARIENDNECTYSPSYGQLTKFSNI